MQAIGMLETAIRMQYQFFLPNNTMSLPFLPWTVGETSSKGPTVPAVYQDNASIAGRSARADAHSRGLNPAVWKELNRWFEEKLARDGRARQKSGIEVRRKLTFVHPPLAWPDMESSRDSIIHSNFLQWVQRQSLLFPPSLGGQG